MATLSNDLAISMGRQVSAIKEMYLAELTEMFRSLNYWGKDSIQGWIDVSIPVVMEAEAIVADVASSLYDAQLEILLDGDYQPGDVDYGLVTGRATRNGVPPEEVYPRAFKPIWRGIYDGLDIAEAVERGVTRLREMFDVDMERVVDHVAINKFANSERIAGYRRVLVGVTNCALCIVASTQTYHKRELKGIHPGCNCKVSPVLSFENPKTLDRDLLEQVHREVEREFGISAKDARQIDYRKILLTRNHGEHGPTLTFSRHSFTGPLGLQTPGE